MKDINDFFALHSLEKTLCYYKTDIVQFYDSIPHHKLLENLKERVKSDRFLRLTDAAIKNPTSSFGVKRSEKKVFNKEGVPQGLSISNVLADIYMSSFDRKLTGVTSKYYRFVDDILLFNLGEDKTCLRGVIEESIKEIDLKLHVKKTVCKNNNRHFEYLGYRFELPKITVRNSSQVNFINSIASMISSFKNNFQVNVKKFKWIDDEAYKRIFIESVNEKITGAISETTRYGWLFYFLEINDEALLHRMDRIIDSFFERLDEFDNRRPVGLKRLSRAYFEAKYNSYGNYIHNYNRYATLQDKIDYLYKLGKLNPDAKYKKEEIEQIFERTKFQNLMHLEKDVGDVS